MISKHIRFLFLFSALLLINPQINSQIIVTVGTGSSASTSGPIATFYNSSATESIYTGTEIGFIGNITKIGYQKASGASTETPNVKIYMKATSLATTGTTNYPLGQNLSEYQLVFNGQLPNTSTTGTMEVVLNTPFRFTSTANNLAVLVVGTTCISSGRPQYKYTTTAAKMSANHTDGSIGCGGTNSFDQNSSFAPVWERPNIIVTLSALSTNEFEVNPIIAIVKNNKLQITSDKIAMKNIMLFDLTGRKIAATDINSNEAVLDLTVSNQIVIAKITTENSTTITKKIML